MSRPDDPSEKESVMEKGPERLKVAAIQMTSIPYQVEENLQKADRMVQEAAARGARIVVLPELFNTGYCYDWKNIKVAEDLSGRTARWFRTLSKKWGIYLIGGMIERDGGKDYNTLLLTSPQGRLASYRKRCLPLQEKCYFTRGDEPLLVDTPLGRIGFGICADLLDEKIWERFRNKVNLLIVSSAWPDFTTGGFLFAKTAVNLRISRMPELLPKRLAESFGVPVAYAGLCGPFDSPLPLLYPYAVRSRFVGYSAVYDRGGVPVSVLKEEEGIAIGTVVTDPMPAEKRYVVDGAVRMMARLDRMLLTIPCRVYRMLNHPKRNGEALRKAPSSS
ncbi:MAG: carbon-nitrogen hydrolase family protein [Candidatus Manganitrophaceae bacterium]|nr:MAG: carbon-nitrogen hydrolase family protein [Candidatus Manganitrophaceae bacterium]